MRLINKAKCAPYLLGAHPENLYLVILAYGIRPEDNPGFNVRMTERDFHTVERRLKNAKKARLLPDFEIERLDDPEMVMDYDQFRELDELEPFLPKVAPEVGEKRLYLVIFISSTAQLGIPEGFHVALSPKEVESVRAGLDAAMAAGEIWGLEVHDLEDQVLSYSDLDRALAEKGL